MIKISDDKLRAIFDEHLSHLIDGDIIDESYFQSVVNDFEESLFTVARNEVFFDAVYTATNRAELNKLVKLLERIGKLEISPIIFTLLASGSLPSSKTRIPDDADLKLTGQLAKILKEAKLSERVTPVIKETIGQIKTGNSNIAAAMIADECKIVWTLLTHKDAPNYISEDDHGLLHFVQAIFDEVLGKDEASARTYFR
ncbi:MAG: hypothetical protein NPIRA05_00300 [Nitrospirales bacterium]|nr:MAG: hypothetical protein NPIRA05_00300 [Nitrospirales bacterium]